MKTVTFAIQEEEINKKTGLRVSRVAGEEISGDELFAIAIACIRNLGDQCGLDHVLEKIMQSVLKAKRM